MAQAVDLAMGLAAADFPFTLAGKALKHAFPEITAEQLLDAIQKAYPTPTPLELAKVLFKAGFSLEQAASRIHQAFPATSATDVAGALKPVYSLTVARAPELAVALARVPFKYEETGAALKHVFPDITADQPVQALLRAYG